jgi:5'-3' exonuclease
VRAAGAGWDVVVVSSDKDLAQLVGGRVTFYDFAKGTRLGPAEVAERYGVRPDQVADLLGLAGDPVDNIPGVPGV